MSTEKTTDIFPKTKDYLENAKPGEVLRVLKAGNERFVGKKNGSRQLLDEVQQTAAGQHPPAIIVSCMDSRTSVEHIFDQGFGDVFSIRIAGNVVNDDILGSLEYACQHVGTKLIMVLGHTSCGAVKGAASADAFEGHLKPLLKKIAPLAQHESDPEKVARLNVSQSLDEILEKSDALRKLHEAGTIGLVGGIYNVQDGRVEIIREEITR